MLAAAGMLPVVLSGGYKNRKTSPSVEDCPAKMPDKAGRMPALPVDRVEATDYDLG